MGKAREVERDIASEEPEVKEAQALSGLKVHFISLVESPANKRKFLVKQAALEDGEASKSPFSFLFSLNRAGNWVGEEKARPCRFIKQITKHFGNEKAANSLLSRVCGFACVAGAGFEPATFGLCVPTTVFTAGPEGTVCGLDFLFTLGQTVRVPAVKSLHLL